MLKAAPNQTIFSSIALSPAAIIEETSTSRTLGVSDNGKVIYCTSGSPVTITMGAGLPVGFSVTILQAGAGRITLASGGFILVAYSDHLSSKGQNATISILSPEENVFFATGDLGEPALLL